MLKKTLIRLPYFNANDIPRPGATFPHAATIVGPRPVAKYINTKIQKYKNDKKCTHICIKNKGAISLNSG